MKRGEIWTVSTPGRQRTVLVMQADPVLEAISSTASTILAVPLQVPEEVRITALTPTIGRNDDGDPRYVADVLRMGPFREPRFDERIGEVSREDLNTVAAAICRAMAL